MSAGTPTTTIRLPAALHSLINVYLRQRETLTLVDPWTMTDFLVAASRELLRKKAWRRGKAQVLQMPVETAEEEMIEASMLDSQSVSLHPSEGDSHHG
jgi:hypothetical protein